MKRPIRITDVAICGILLILGIIVFYFCFNELWFGDDIAYQYIFEDKPPLDLENARRIQTFGDIVESQYNHYLIYNGRVVAHTLVQLFCGILGQGWFAIFNGLAYIGLVCMLQRVAGVRTMSVKTTLTAVILVILCFQTVMVPSNQISYIWMAILVLAFVLVFTEKVSVPGLFMPVIMLLSVLAGNSQETYVIGVGFSVGIYAIRHIKSMSATQWMMLTGFFIGAAFLCLSPGIIHRASLKAQPIILQLITLIFTLKITFILIVVVVAKKVTSHVTFRQLYSENSFYWNIIAGCILFNLIIGIGSNRSLFGAELFSAVLLLRLLSGHSFRGKWLILFGLLTVIWLGEQFRVRAVREKRLAQIEQEYVENRHNGAVYIDPWDSWLIEMFSYTEPITEYIEDGFYTKSIQKCFSRKYPDLPPIKIYPECLEGIDSIDIGNKYFEFDYRAGKRCYIQSKKNPARFIVERKLLGLFNIRPKEIDFSEPNYETDCWRAVIKDEFQPLISYRDVAIVEY